MGFFSWKTSDTNKSVSNIHSGKGVFPVHLLDPKGGSIKELHYEGYGDFGGEDVYVLLALWNYEMLDLPEEGLVGASLEELRLIGIDLAFGDKELKYPVKIVEDGSLEYDDVEASEMCPYQGYFYD